MVSSEQSLHCLHLFSRQAIHGPPCFWPCFLVLETVLLCSAGLLQTQILLPLPLSAGITSAYTTTPGACCDSDVNRILCCFVHFLLSVLESDRNSGKTLRDAGHTTAKLPTLWQPGAERERLQGAKTRVTLQGWCGGAHLCFQYSGGRARQISVSPRPVLSI